MNTGSPAKAAAQLSNSTASAASAVGQRKERGAIAAQVSALLDRGARWFARDLNDASIRHHRLAIPHPAHFLKLTECFDG